MNQVFVNSKHFTQFDKDGFIKLDRCVISAEEITALSDFLQSSGVKKSTEIGFDVSMEHNNKNLVKEMMDKIQNIVLPKLAPIIQHVKPFIATYIIKDPNVKNIILPHQDWTFIEDEENMFSFTCWIPLVDVDLKNGCMGFIKGSHKFFDTIRASPSSNLSTPLSNHLYSLIPYMELVAMKAGELLIFNNKVFHASLPNTSAFKRPAVGIVFTCNEAQFCHYYLKPGTKDTLLKYKISTDFFHKYDDKILSDLYESGKIISDFELLNEVKYNYKEVNKSVMKRMVMDVGNVFNNDVYKYINKTYKKEIKFNFIDFLRNLFTTKLN